MARLLTRQYIPYNYAQDPTPADQDTYLSPWDMLHSSDSKYPQREYPQSHHQGRHNHAETCARVRTSALSRGLR